MSATRDEIRDWFIECSGEVTETGGLSALALTHFQASGAEVELHSVASTNTKFWGDCEKLADVFDAIATRHARGVLGGGAQQFQITAIFGSGSSKPAKRVLPFIRVGLSSHGFTAGGGLATEPPTATGTLAMTQRWGEIVLQGAVAKDQALFGAMGGMLKDLYGSHRDLLAQNAEWFLSYKKLLAEVATQQSEQGIKLVVAKRNAQLLHDMSRLLPSLVPGFPQAAKDTAVLRAVGAAFSEEQVKYLVGLAAGGEPQQQAAAAALMARLEEMQRTENDDAEKLRELQRTPHGLDPESDAAGEVVLDPRAELLRLVDKQANGAPPKQLETNGASNGPNGHTSGTSGHGSTGSNGAANGSAPSEADALWDDLFATVPPGQLNMMIGALAGKDPDLARRIRERAAKKEK